MSPRLSGEGCKQFLVRMPPEMHQALKADALDQDRSMAQTIRYAVRLYLDNRTEDSPR